MTTTRGARPTWQDKWASICSKLETCRAECRTAFRSDQKCKDSIEAVVADLWNLKEWLWRDPGSGVSHAETDAFVNTPEAFNIRGCADLTTLDKHYRVSNKHRDDTRLGQESVAVHSDGYPLVYSATRDYGDGNTDHWEDAIELAIRAAMEWEQFLVSRGLLTAATIKREEPAPPKPSLFGRVLRRTRHRA